MARGLVRHPCRFLAENPIAEDDDYRMEVISFLPQLIRLDKDEVTEEEREEAEQIAEQRKQSEIQAEVRRRLRIVDSDRRLRDIKIEKTYASLYLCFYSFTFFFFRGFC